MLRKILGDETFFAGIRSYYNLYAGRNVLTEDFRAVMESVSGRRLATFFHQWFEQPGWPEYRVSWRWDAAAKEVELEFTQQQTGGLFEMPLDVAFTLGQRRELRTVEVSARTATVRVALPEAPSAVEIDPGGWVLKEVVVSSP